MSLYKNLSTMWKLLTGFGVLAAMLAFAGYQGYAGMEAVEKNFNVLYKNHALGLAQVKDANLALVRTARALRNALLDDSEADVRGRIEEIRKYRSEFRQTMTDFRANITVAANMAKATAIDKAFEETAVEQDRILALALAKKDVEARASLKQLKAMGDGLDAALDELVNLKLGMMMKSAADTQALIAGKQQLLGGVVIASVLIACILGLVIGRIISTPLTQTVGVLQLVADGDLTTRLDIRTKDEVGQMAKALNDALAKMQQTLREVSESAASVAGASHELAGASDQLSSGAQEQAASLEETAASLEEITATVKQNSESAHQANQMASSARDAADTGGQVVNAAVTAMSEINVASKKIADIITAIDEIAFQTNLLALNAAVEAARAGEQGRGFAVVATEVRNLAQRSAKAAKEIKALIQDSVRKIDVGTDLVNRSGKTLTEIMTAVKRVSDVVAEISAASLEQSNGLDQVSRAMAQMDQVTQANSAQTEELSSTAQDLSAHAAQLESMVGTFKVDTESAERARRSTNTSRHKKTQGRSQARPSASRTHVTSASLTRLAQNVQNHSSEEAFVSPDGFEQV